MDSKKAPCIFKTLLKIKDVEWEWCSLFNGEITQLNCEKCVFKNLPQNPIRIRREIIA